MSKPARSEAQLMAALREKLLSGYVENDDGCWIWQGTKDLKGYGRVAYGARTRHKSVHRTMYEFLVGPIPAGLQLDHLCRVRSCCNPAHLEPVTNWENFLRGNSFGAVALRTDKCRSGHPLTLRKSGARYCKECFNTRRRQRRDAARAAGLPVR